MTNCKCEVVEMRRETVVQALVTWNHVADYLGTQGKYGLYEQGIFNRCFDQLVLEAGTQAMFDGFEIAKVDYR